MTTVSMKSVHSTRFGDRRRLRVAAAIGAGAVAVSALLGPSVVAQSAAPQPRPGSGATARATSPAEAVVAPPPGYLIGANDVLSILFWREKDLTVDVTVRPDGRISLPLLNDVEAAGLTPEELRVKIQDQAQAYVQDPNVTVLVKQINSRKVFITGRIPKPGPYNLTGPMTVLQLISEAGGVQEYADTSKIVVVRTENGKPVRYPFNYKWVLAGKNLRQNIELKPGDTIVVP
jgi:polysaccharide export outer membrane protein